MSKPWLIDGRLRRERRMVLADVRGNFASRAEEIMGYICQLQRDYRDACLAASVDNRGESIELAAAADAMLQFITAYDSGIVPMYANYDRNDVKGVSDSIREYAERVNNARLAHIVDMAKQHNIPPRPGGNKEFQK